jgi:hypothetical protein
MEGWRESIESRKEEEYKGSKYKESEEMKLWIGIFLLFPLGLLAQGKASVVFIFIDSRGPLDYFGSYPALKPARGDKIAPTNETRDGEKGTEEITFENLEPGKYTYIVQSFFGGREIEFELKNGETYTQKFYLDTPLNDTTKFFYKIDQLKNGENLQYNFISQGCFHQREEEIIVSKENDQFYCKMDTLKIKLDAHKIQLLKRFELSLEEDFHSGCTTTDTYFYTFRGKKYKIKDGTCHWSGWNYLIANLNNWTIDEYYDKR